MQIFMTFEMRSKFTNQFIKFYVNTVLKTPFSKRKANKENRGNPTEAEVRRGRNKGQHSANNKKTL